MRLLVPVVLLAALAAACGGGSILQATPAPPSAGVTIESISPSSAIVGSEITITGSGFTATDNDVAFSNPAYTGYLNELASTNGSTLRFALPDNASRLLAVCAVSQLKTGEGCPLGGLPLPLGEGEVYVVNDNGEGNHVTFTVLGTGTPEATPAGN